MRNITVILAAIVIAMCAIRASAVDGKGMTWTVVQNFATQVGYSMVEIGCNGCNPYKGDTLCTTQLPILCYSNTDYNRPPYNAPACNTPNCVQPKWFYTPWSGSYLTITPVKFKGSEIGSQEHADKLCMKYLGDEFRAVYHGIGSWVEDMSTTKYFFESWPSVSSGLRHSGDWNCYGYGQIKVTGRFWAFDKDQRSNCWNN
jgi:hypothetical protein